MKKQMTMVLVIGIVVVICLGLARIVIVKRESKGIDESSLKSSTPKNVVQNNSTDKAGQAETSDMIHTGQTKTATVQDNQPSLAFLPWMKFAPEGLNVKNNTFVFDSKRVDVNGDGTVDDVVLIGENKTITIPTCKTLVLW